jgi:hypothetical protein
VPVCYKHINNNAIFFRAGDSEESKNPMVELFYGQYRAEGVNEGIFNFVFDLFPMFELFFLKFTVIKNVYHL